MSEKIDTVDEELSVTAVAPSEKQKSDVIIKSSAFIPGEPHAPIVPIYSVIESQSSQVQHAWGWLIGTVIFCSWTTSFAYTVFISEKPLPRAYDWGWSPALTTQIVNVASHVAVIFTGGLVGAVLDALSWSLAYRRKGTTMGTFLAVQNNTSLMDVGRLFMIPGSQWIWCIMRFAIIGISFVVGVLLLASVTTQRVYFEGPLINVTAGLADVHASVLALERLNVIPNTSTTINSTSAATLQDTGINMMVTGAMNSILTDPSFVISVAPIACESSDCKTLFLPGGMELVRSNGAAINTTLFPNESVIIVNNAPGFQLEYESATYEFNYTTDCTMYGYDVSSFFACLKFNGHNITAGATICPPAQMFDGTCISDQNYTKTLDATITLGLYQRIATVSYDKTNFSIIDVRNIENYTSSTSEQLISDFQKMFTIMYPPLSNIISELVGIIEHPSEIWPDLAYWSSVFCVQSELTAAKWLEIHGFPTYSEGKQDLLEGLMTIPIQFGTMLWQFVDIGGVPSTLSTTANFSTVTYRPRSPIWPVALFAIMVFSLVLWAIACLIYIHFAGNVEPENNDHVKNAFKTGNPYDVDDKGFFEVLWIFIKRPFSGKHREKSRALNPVVAKKVKKNVAADEKKAKKRGWAKEKEEAFLIVRDDIKEES